MTKISSIFLKCPCCDNNFDSRSWASTNTFGGKSTDFHKHAAGYQLLPLLIHTCSDCGFTGYEEEFESILDDNLKKTIHDKLTPIVKGNNVIPEKQYEYAAWIAEWSDKSSVEIAYKYLCAAWCANDEKHHEQESIYRKKAIEHYEKAIQKNEIDKDELATTTYLIGELYRRVGDKINSDLWFDKVPQVVGGNKENQWVIDLAIQQKENPREYFDTK